MICENIVYNALIDYENQGKERYFKMKKRVSILLVMCLVVCLLSACGKDNKNDKEKPTKKDNSTEVDNDISDENELYEQLFDINNPVSIQIKISDEELDKIQEDYEKYDRKNSKSPIYRMAEKVVISIGDEVYEIEEVGIRLKGNTSRVPVYDEETGEPNLSHYRLSFNETFDNEEYYGEDAKVWNSEEERQARKDRRFATLKGMEVKWNRCYDDSHIREIYANDMFRDMGVLSQHVNLCSLGINGENYGVVNIYEPVDKIFIERNLPESEQGGDLYKCGWTFKPVNYIKSSVTYGIEDKAAGKFYNYDLKTNEKDSDYSTLINMLDVLNKNDVSKEDLESIMDTDYLVKFLAVSYFVGNPDDIRNNYNNHYLYFLKDSGKAIFIPYDNDRCLGMTYDWNPEGAGMTDVSPYSEYCESTSRSQVNPVITKTILGDDAYFKDAYADALKKVAESDWLTDAKFNEYYETAKQNYESVVVPSIEFANADNDMFKFSLEGKFTSGDDANMSFSEYAKRILEAYKEG